MTDGTTEAVTGGLPGIPAFALGRLPRVTFGEGSFARVPELTAAHGRRVLLVTGGRSLAASGRRAVLLEGLARTGAHLVGEVAVLDEPSPDIVDGAVARHRGEGVEVVVGVGGGSVLDAAKAIAGLLRTGTSVRDHLEGVGPGLPYPGPSVPFVAAPTTAGTGSEASRNAVISERGPGGYKRSFRDEALVAADAVVDPDLLAGAGPHRIAANGMDALTQLLESFLSLRASPVTDALALAGLEAARDGLLAWHADPDGPTAPIARSRVAFASLLSGICLANAGLGAVHGLASPLGALLPIPHGVACGVTLAGVTRANLAALEARDPGSPALARYAVLGRLLAHAGPEMPDPAARGALMTTLEAWSAALALPGLATFGLDVPGIPAVVAGSRGSSMRTNPIVLEDAELNRVLREAL
jgi:alcohol dehydrogenase class IV